MKKLIGLIVVVEDTHLVWTIKNEIIVNIIINDRLVAIYYMRSSLKELLAFGLTSTKTSFICSLRCEKAL